MNDDESPKEAPKFLDPDEEMEEEPTEEEINREKSLVAEAEAEKAAADKVKNLSISEENGTNQNVFQDNNEQYKDGIVLQDEEMNALPFANGGEDEPDRPRMRIKKKSKSDRKVSESDSSDEEGLPKPIKGRLSEAEKYPILREKYEGKNTDPKHQINTIFHDRLRTEIYKLRPSENYADPAKHMKLVCSEEDFKEEFPTVKYLAFEQRMVYEAHIFRLPKFDQAASKEISTLRKLFRRPPNPDPALIVVGLPGGRIWLIRWDKLSPKSKDSFKELLNSPDICMIADDPEAFFEFHMG